VWNIRGPLNEGYNIVKKKEKREKERERRVGISLFLVNLMFTRDPTNLAISRSYRVILEFGRTIFFIMYGIQCTVRNNEMPYKL
jgi:hypothetical protein